MVIRALTLAALLRETISVYNVAKEKLCMYMPTYYIQQINVFSSNNNLFIHSKSDVWKHDYVSRHVKTTLSSSFTLIMC